MQQARSEAMPQKQKKKGGKSKSKKQQTPETKDAAAPPSALPLKSILAAALVAGAATLFSTTRSCGAPRVVEEGDLRYLVNNGGVIGVQRIGAPEQAVFRGWVVQRTASSLRDKARNALVVGLGGGSVAQYWRNTSLSVHAVEIDARVAKLAETHFGVTRGTTLVEEGLRFIRKRADDVRRKRGPPYDLLNIDVIDAGDPWGSATWRFLGKSALSASKKALTPQQGLLVFTIVIGSLADQRSRQYLKVATQRLGAVFPRVRAYRDSPLSEPGATNVVFFASDGGLDDEIGINHDERAAAAELSGAEPGSEDWVAAMHKSWEVARCDAGTCALLANVSDTFAPDGSAAAPPDKGYSAQVAAQLREHFSPSLFQEPLLCALVGGSR